MDNTTTTTPPDLSKVRLHGPSREVELARQILRIVNDQFEIIEDLDLDGAADQARFMAGNIRSDLFPLFMRHLYGRLDTATRQLSQLRHPSAACSVSETQP